MLHICFICVNIYSIDISIGCIFYFLTMRTTQYKSHPHCLCNKRMFHCVFYHIRYNAYYICGCLNTGYQLDNHNASTCVFLNPPHAVVNSRNGNIFDRVDVIISADWFAQMQKGVRRITENMILPSDLVGNRAV